MYLEYDPLSMIYRIRFGHVWTDVRGERYWLTRADACNALLDCGLKLGRKTASRTWEVLCA